MPLQMPHVSVCDSHNSLPQSKHCVLAVLEQGKPSASAEFLISTTSQWVIATRPSIVFCLISIQKPPKLVDVEGHAVLGNSNFHPLHFDLGTYTEHYIVQSLVHFYPRCQPRCQVLLKQERKKSQNHSPVSNRLNVCSGFTGVFKNRDTGDSLTGMARLNFMVNFPDSLEIIRVNLRHWFTGFASKQCRYFFHTVLSTGIRRLNGSRVPILHRLMHTHAIPQQAPDVAHAQTIPLYRPSANIPDSEPCTKCCALAQTRSNNSHNSASKENHGTRLRDSCG